MKGARRKAQGKEERMQPSKDQNLNESILLLTLDYWILESMH